MPASSPAETVALLRQREALRAVIEEISMELELRPLLTSIVRHACELIGADDGGIGLLDEERGVIRTEAVYRMPPSELGAEMGPGVGLAGAVLVARRPIVLARYGDVPQPTQPGLAERAVIGMPILWRDALIGFFGIGAAPPRRFADADVETLSLFARHAAIAIQNARLFARNQELAVLEERQRLARDLHDSVTQMLASATMVAQSVPPLLSRDRAEAARRVERVVQLNRSALAEMRALLRELQPAAPLPVAVVASGEFPVPGVVRLRRQGLVAAIEAELAEVAAQGIAVVADLSGYPRRRAQPASGGEGEVVVALPPEQEELILRILQEAIANALKHAAPHRIAVALRRDGSQLVLAVQDDGAGFDARAYLAAPPKPGREGGMGLSTMRTRARALGGQFRLESAPGLGTEVEVSLPLPAPPSG